MFQADEGKVFVQRDYKQAESWLVAYLSGSESLIELLNDPTRDLHTENAAKINNCSLDSISYVQRYLAKKVGHGSNYGLEEHRLVQTVNEEAEVTGVRIDYRQAKELLSKYFLLYPEIREVYWKEVERELQYSRTLVSAFGRKRTFYGRWDEKLLREAYSYQPQSTVGDLGAKAIVGCYTELEPRIEGFETLLNVHDSVMGQCLFRDVEHVASEMARVMAIPITVKGRTFTIPTDCKVGFNWGSRSKREPELNPNGLVDLDVWLRERKEVA